MRTHSAFYAHARRPAASLLVMPLVALLIGRQTLRAAPGDLDPTFGSGGVAQLPSPNNNGSFAACRMDLQSDGKVVIVGYVLLDDGAAQLAIARLNGDGTPDYTFGVGGLATAPMHDDPTPQNSWDWSKAYDVAIQVDGKIVVVGEAGRNTRLPDDSLDIRTLLVVARFCSDGSLDPSFGVRGKFRGSPQSATAVRSRTLRQADAS